MNKKISVRLEGGTGDCLLATRFIPAIKELYPDSEITAYLDTEGNPVQKRVIDYLYPSIYKNTITIPNKKYKEFWIESQYGLESQKGFEENVPDYLKKQMVDEFDDHFNFHLDSLDFLEWEDINWQKYFYTFPKPEVSEPNHIGPYIISHLVSSTSLEHRMESFYVSRLVMDIDKLCKEFNWQHIIISQPEFNKFYEEAQKTTTNSHILNGNIIDVCDMVVNAKLMISVDSGFRPIAYPLMPVISFSKQCSAPNQMQPSHILRWNPIKPYFPLNWNSSDIIKTARKLLENKVYSIFPEICLTDTKLSDILIKREYKVSEKSILNETNS